MRKISLKTQILQLLRLVLVVVQLGQVLRSMFIHPERHFSILIYFVEGEDFVLFTVFAHFFDNLIGRLKIGEICGTVFSDFGCYTFCPCIFVGPVPYSEEMLGWNKLFIEQWILDIIVLGLLGIEKSINNWSKLRHNVFKVRFVRFQNWTAVFMFFFRRLA